jgi:hypothetical protein
VEDFLMLRCTMFFAFAAFMACVCMRNHAVGEPPGSGNVDRLMDAALDDYEQYDTPPDRSLDDALLGAPASGSGDGASSGQISAPLDANFPWAICFAVAGAAIYLFLKCFCELSV